ncbi:hypothetical protein A2U01_0000871, partial [Trifolium medium]|nr:hypothetical protein [Trifolium medium]
TEKNGKFERTIQWFPFFRLFEEFRDAIDKGLSKFSKFVQLQAKSLQSKDCDTPEMSNVGFPISTVNFSEPGAAREIAYS